MKILKGNRPNGFEEVLNVGFNGVSLHNIKVDSASEEEAAQGMYLLLLDVGNDELVQVQLSKKELVLLNAALKSEGSWIYADDE